MPQKEKIYGLLGLAQRAGKVASGEAATEANIQKHKAKLVIIAEDASERTKDQFYSLCRRNDTQYVTIGVKDQLGLALGKSPRSVLAILDDNFAQSLLK